MTIRISATESSEDALAALRSLAANPRASETEARIAAEQQAAYLQRLLAESAKSIPDRLIELIPNLDITYANDFPGHGFSFWDDDAHQWCIYLRSRDTGDEQILTMLQEIKYIVDEPLREASDDPDSPTWTTLAYHFAQQVIERQAQVAGE